MATTSPDNIWTQDSADNYDLVVDAAATAASIQTALVARANSYKGTTAQRTAFTATAPEGTTWADTNGEKILWIKQGASWQRVWPVEDTGWVNCILLPGFQPRSGYHPRVRRIGSVVYFEGQMMNGGLASGGVTQLLSLPDSRFNPSTPEVRWLGFQTNYSHTPYGGWLNSTGNLYIQVNSSLGVPTNHYSILLGPWVAG